MRPIIITLALFVASLAYGQTDFYSLSAKTIDGEGFSFDQLKGKKVLVVNVASKCGFTPQYEDLETLYKM
jgi:glutathione peroxidase-family protein